MGKRFSVRRCFRPEVRNYVRPGVERVDEAFQFPEEGIVVEDCRNKSLAQRNVPRFGVDRERRSGRAFQHMLRFEKCRAEFFRAFRRRMPEISAKDDPVAFGNVVNGERTAVDLEEINSIWVVPECHAQAFSKVFYEFETVHFAFWWRMSVSPVPDARTYGETKTPQVYQIPPDRVLGGSVFPGAGAAVFPG